MKNNKEKQNPFEQYGSLEIKELKKGIFNSLNYGENSVKFEKLGLELKDHILENLLPKINQEIAEIKIKLDTFLQSSIIQPIENNCKGILTEEEFPYKTFSWEQSHKPTKLYKSFGMVEEECSDCFPEEDSTIIYEERCQYNDLVWRLKDLMTDIKIANTLINNLEDNILYTLNLEQLTSLGL